MAIKNAIQAKANSSKQLAIGFIDSASTLITLCAKKTSRAAKKLCSEPKAKLKFQMAKPRQLMNAISSKAARLRTKKKGKSDDGKGALWQKTILMGEKCDPLDFSGVIYYDSYGNQVEEPPMRSPRASPRATPRFEKVCTCGAAQGERKYFR